MSYTIGKGNAEEITLSNGKKKYTGVGSFNSIEARKKKLKVKLVEFEGCCIPCNINSRAKEKDYFPIKINGIDIYTYINRVAEDDSEIK